MNQMTLRLLLLLGVCAFPPGCGPEPATAPARERVLLDEGWRFFRYQRAADADQLVYDVRPEVVDDEDGEPADARPEARLDIEARQDVLKAWILPTANAFIADPADRHERPDGSPGENFAFVQADFDDSEWQEIRVPHDWAIEGPFMPGEDAEVGGGMGRLPSPGTAWYRKTLDIPEEDAGKSIYLDVEGAMSHAIVWFNGRLVGGWPYGYASWRLDLTPWVDPGGVNQLAIRLDNPPASSRWYPGGGLYRNVWLVKTGPVHVAQWGTQITTPEVTAARATVDIDVSIENRLDDDVAVSVSTEVYAADVDGGRTGRMLAGTGPVAGLVPSRGQATLASSLALDNPRLWGPPPEQAPHRYVAVTSLSREGQVVDEYETRFGIREIRFDPEAGVIVNGRRTYIRGVNQHHDLGALGAAFNLRAAERQLEILRDAGVNAVRMAHNPPAPDLLELTDRMGFLVIDEIFDVWERKKTPLDFHLVFSDWHEADLRAFIRRDRNHPSVIAWSVGNEVGEQYTGEEGALIGRRLHDIVREEDPTRPTTAAFNYAKPDMALPPVFDLVNLNYQGEGIRDAGAYDGLPGIRTPPLYPAFRERFPDKLILSSENAAALSSRGEYLFPVAPEFSAPVGEMSGGDAESQHVSAYELYTAPFGSSADKVFASLDRHPYVAGGFVWSGWDYLGEPTPWYGARSSYFGIVDLAGFPKDRYYLYQSRWRPELPTVHILPHWNWPDRAGRVTPVHVFTSGDEAELFLNGESRGRKSRGPFEYRLRWDDVVYEAGELRVVAYRDGEIWAEDIVKTSGPAARIALSSDREQIRADGVDLAFLTVEIVDRDGHFVPDADDEIQFSIDGPGFIVATDNGDPTDMTAFPETARRAFNGRALAIVGADKDSPGPITVTASAEGLAPSRLAIESR